MWERERRIPDSPWAVALVSASEPFDEKRNFIHRALLFGIVIDNELLFEPGAGLRTA